MRNTTHMAALLAAFMLFVSCSKADVPENDYVKYQLRCPAKACKVYPLDSAAVSQELNFKVSFLENGRVGEKQYFFNDGSKAVCEKYHYGKRGLLESVYTYDKDGGDSGMYFYTYDGRIIEDCKYYGMNSEMIYWWHHSNDGCRIVATDFYVEGVLQSRSSSVFSGNSRIETVRDASDSAYLHNEYLYYNLTEQLLLSFHNEEGGFSIEYNDKALPCSSTAVMVDPCGGLYWNEALAPDARVTYEYEYDALGNWIVRRMKCGDSLVEALAREISY